MKILKGKRVAVIGAADTILDSEDGEFIESFDIILRMKKAPYSWSQSQNKYIGKRTDYLLHSFFENEISGGGKIDAEFYESFGIQKIINPNNNSIGKRALLNFYKRNSITLNTYLLKKEITDLICAGFENKLPTMGFYALAVALLSETEEVYLKGFSFFQTAYADGYRNNFKDIKSNKEHIAHQNIHDPDLEFEKFKELVKTSPSKKITLDNYLKNLLA